MAPQDLWYLKKKVEGPDGKEQRVRSKRYGRGKRWRVSYVDPHTGRTKNPSFRTFAEAERFENNIESDIDRGKYVDPVLGRIKVDVYADQYCDRLQVRPRTKANAKGWVKNHIRPTMSHLAMLQVRSTTIQDWIASRQAADPPLAPGSIRTIYNSLLFPMFKRALIDGVIGQNPCQGIVLPELPDGEYDLPTPEQVEQMAEGLDEHYRPVPFVGAGCGLRTGEVFGLELADVDFLRRKVHVRKQLNMSAKGELYLGPPKTKTSKRTVDLPDMTGAELAAHIKLHPPQAVTVLDRTNPSKPKHRKALLLFLDEKGRPMRAARWSELWLAGMDSAGLPEGMYSMTSLRHFFATALIYAGRNVKTVQLAMGHATPTITLNTYLGYWPDDERNSTREVLDEVFAGVSTRSRTQSVPAAKK